MDRERLTAKESAILRQLVFGKSRKQIADALSIRIGTLDTHFRRIYTKIKTHSMVETCIWAIKNGYHSDIRA